MLIDVRPWFLTPSALTLTGGVQGYANFVKDVRGKALLGVVCLCLLDPGLILALVRQLQLIVHHEYPSISLRRSVEESQVRVDTYHFHAEMESLQEY